MKNITDPGDLMEIENVKNHVWLTHDEIMAMFPPDNVINITDPRDIAEFERRMKKKTCQPLKVELYSINPNFNGIYSDPQNR